MIVAATALAGVALILSAVILTFLLAVGAVVFAILWWKTRGLRKQMTQQMRDIPPPGGGLEQGPADGEVIEGEAIRVDAKRNTP
ncbi:MAG: hypothetical protein ACOY4U_08270 [Pseudomonadota bacterium]